MSDNGKSRAPNLLYNGLTKGTSVPIESAVNALFVDSKGFQKIFESKLNYSTEVFDPLGDLICISSKDEHERTIIVSVRELYNVASILSVRITIQNNNQREVRRSLRAGINIYANNFEYWIIYIFDHCYRSINLIFNVLKLSAFWNDSRNWNGRLRLIKAARRWYIM